MWLRKGCCDAVVDHVDMNFKTREPGNTLLCSETHSRLIGGCWLPTGAHGKDFTNKRVLAPKSGFQTT